MDSPTNTPSPSSSSPLLPPFARQRTFSHASYSSQADDYTSPIYAPYSLDGHALRASRIGSPAPSLIDRNSFAPDATSYPLISDPPDDDDDLHKPDDVGGRASNRGSIFTVRGITNIGFLVLLLLGLVGLFAGFPIYSHYTRTARTSASGLALGTKTASSTSQIPHAPLQGVIPPMIDAATPLAAHTKPSFGAGSEVAGGEEWQLVFSDEFNVDGRTFYPGDDPYWEAVDLHYWGTNDLEWYDPKQATTKGGYLHLTLDNADPVSNHNMSYISGMLQSWNKFCFTGGMIEVSVQLPGSNSKPGLWPAVWSMGNLGRAGFGASLDGMWPYTYDACDVGTLPNQTFPGTQTPLVATQNGDPGANNELSWLPGQRLSACTCPGDEHPGPKKSDGSYVGRAAPELDVFEALANAGFGQVSQSAQWAPFNAAYEWQSTAANLIIPNATNTALNGYAGGSTQQTTSALATTNQACYELEAGCFATFGFEYKPGYAADGSYITWIVNDTASWSLMGAGMGADPATQISARLVPAEPMYLIMNLGFSKNFAHNLDPTTMQFPTSMLVDYVRVYQPANAVNVGCDPAGYPTMDYISAHMDAYTNPNLTNWSTGPNAAYYGQPQPRNSLAQSCSASP